MKFLLPASGSFSGLLQLEVHGQRSYASELALLIFVDQSRVIRGKGLDTPSSIQQHTIAERVGEGGRAGDLRLDA